MTINHAFIRLPRSFVPTMLLIALTLFGGRLPAMAIKVKVYSLAELVQTAGAIVRAEIRISDTATNAVVEKILKGNPPDQFGFGVLAYRPDDLTLTNGQKALLFVQGDSQKGFSLVGYGDQAVWPKDSARWPYTEAHVSSLAATEDAVRRLLNVYSATNDSVVVTDLREMLGHAQRFYQITALEFLEQTKHERFAKACLSDVERLAESNDDTVRQPARAIKAAVTGKQEEQP